MKRQRPIKQPDSPKIPLPKFETEALFLQAIAGLLVRLPGIEGVQQLHSPQEFGKDLVFWTKGPLGERIACACVLKRDKISGDVQSPSGARTVFHQVEQAFDTPYPDGSGQDIWIQRVYVLTPTNISAEAINSVRGALRSRAGQIVFLGGHDLFSLFKRYWPDYYADEASALVRYLERVRVQFHQHGPLERLSGIYDLGNIDGATKSVYVPLDLQRDIGQYKLAEKITRLLLKDWEPSKLAEGQPSVERIQKRLRNLELKLRNQASELSRLLDHLSSWEICPATQTVDRALARYIKSVDKLVDINRASDLSAARDGLVAALFTEHPILLKYDSELLPQVCDGEPLITLPGDVLDSAVHRKVMMIDQCISEHFGRTESPATSFVLAGSEWRRSRSSFIVAGDPGSGKTSFCRWNALQDIEHYSTGDSDVLPIYLPMQAFTDIAPSDISDLISIAAPFSAFLGDVRSQLQSGKFSRARLYCDGLDEVPTRERRSAIIRILRVGLAEDPRFQVVATTRDYIRGKELDWLPRFHLKGLDLPQLRDLCEQWLGKESPAVQEFLRQLRTYPALVEIVRVPLLATLTILVYRRTGQLPDSRGRLYTMFVELLAGGWDLAKGVLRPSRFGRHVKLIVLTRLAERVHRARKRVFGVQEIREAAISTCMQPAGSTRWVMEAFANELIEDGLLTVAGEEGQYQFRHQSFQEYLTARELVSIPDSRPISKILEEFLKGDVWWKEVLDFYLLLSGNPIELFNWLNRVSKKRGTRAEQLRHLESLLSKAYPNFSSTVKIGTVR